MTEGEGARLKAFIMAATNILQKPRYPDPDRIIGKPGETCDQLVPRISKGKSFQFGFQGDGQIIFTAEKVSGRKK